MTPVQTSHDARAFARAPIGPSHRGHHPRSCPREARVMQRDGGSLKGKRASNRRTAPTIEGQLMNMLHGSGGSARRLHHDRPAT